MTDRFFIDAKLEATREIRTWLDQIEQVNGPAFKAAEVELCLVEVATNIIVHGYGTESEGRIGFSYSCESGKPLITVTEQSPPFELPAATDLPESPTVNGYGLHIIRKIATKVGVERQGDSNVWSLEFPVTDPTEQQRIKVRDRLDLAAAPELREQLSSLIGSGKNNILVDLAEVEFCDSAGLAALVAAMKTAREGGGDVKLVRPVSDEAYKVFELTKFCDIFEFVKVQRWT